MIFCGDCGNRLTPRSGVNKRRYYVCSTYNFYGANYCNQNRVYEDELIEFVKVYLRQCRHSLKGAIENLDNIIQKELRNAIFLKNIGDNRFMVIDSIGEYNCGIKQEIEEEYCRYDFIPHNINDFINIKTNCYSAITNCDDIFIVLLENIDKYQEIEAWWSGITGSIGNFQFCKDFESLAFDEREIKKHCAGANNVNLVFNITPTIDIPLLLENTTASEELYYPYEYSVTGNTKTEITLDDTVYNAVIGTDIAPSYKLKEYKTQFMDLSGESIFVESKLQSL
jgi:hypothetical protein